MELNLCTLYSTPLGLLKHLMRNHGFHPWLLIIKRFRLVLATLIPKNSNFYNFLMIGVRNNDVVKQQLSATEPTLIQKSPSNKERAFK